MKKYFSVLICFLFCGFCFAEENEVYTEELIEKTVKHKIEWTISFEPVLILNTEDVKYSAPSPVVFPFSFGIIFPAELKLSFQPRLSLFANYLLWYEDCAYPAEIENRTATSFNCLLDFPAVYRFDITEKQMLEAGGGLSLLLRYAKLSNGLDEDDEGYSGSAGSDTDEINKWFWKDGNFLFISGNVDYLYKFSRRIKAGPEFRFYIPVGSLVSGNGLYHAMFSLGVKARF